MRCGWLAEFLSAKFLKKLENWIKICIQQILKIVCILLMCFYNLTLSLAAPFAPPCQEALGLIGPRKKEKKTGFDDVS